MKPMTHTITVKLPEEIYHRLKQSAQVTNMPVEEVVLRWVTAGMPPSVHDLPEDYRQECLSLEPLGDKKLRQVAQSALPAQSQRRYGSLLRKNQADTLNTSEQEQLRRLGTHARRSTVLKAYAFALLRWRGCPFPAAAQLRRHE
jgi:hypothetical protein